MKVCLVSPIPPPRGGIGIWTEGILNEAKKHSGIEIYLVDISPRWRSVYRNEHWRRIIGGGLQLVRDYWHVWRVLANQRARALHLCTSAQWALIRDILVLWLARFYYSKTFYHLHFGRVHFLSQEQNWEWRLLTKAIALADTVIVLDKQTRETISTFFPLKRVAQIPNFVDRDECERAKQLPSIFPRCSNLPRVSYVGWVIPTKGVLELVQAAVALADRVPFELEIIGPHDPAYLKRILDVGAPFGERLLVREEIPHDQVLVVLRDTDVLVLPSYTEGFPNVVIEAMAFGKPVIGTDVGAIREILEEGEFAPCGIVIPPKDIQALEDALARLLLDPQLRKSMGDTARAKVEREYECNVVFAKLMQLWGCQRNLGDTVC